MSKEDVVGLHLTDSRNEQSSLLLPELAAIQEETQRNKNTGRTLEEYNRYLFPAALTDTAGGKAVDALLGVGAPTTESLQGFLLHMYALTERRVSWVDMGGGEANAMSMLMSSPGFSECVDMLVVDALDYSGDSDAEPIVSPQRLVADIGSIVLDKPADFITSVESIQYLDNPLKAITEWYNQLASNGLLLVTAGHAWMRFIQDRNADPEQPMLMRNYVSDLQKAGVQVAWTDDVEWDERALFPPNGSEDAVQRLLMYKKPNTTLSLNAKVHGVREMPALAHYKYVKYEKIGENLITVDTKEPLS